MTKKRVLKRNSRGTTSLPNTKGRQAAQRKYNAKPEVIKRRAERNASRRLMEKKGIVRKGDKKDVDHRNRNTADNSPGNLRVMSPSKNRAGGGPKPGSKRKK